LIVSEGGGGGGTQIYKLQAEKRDKLAVSQDGGVKR